MTKTATVHAQQMWEYLELTRKTVPYLVNEMNEIGHHGWELVTLLQAKDRKGELAWTAILKRPFVPDGAMSARPSTQSASPSAPAAGMNQPARLETTQTDPSQIESEFELEEVEEPPREDPPKAEEA